MKIKIKKLKLKEKLKLSHHTSVSVILRAHIFKDKFNGDHSTDHRCHRANCVNLSHIDQALLAIQSRERAGCLTKLKCSGHKDLSACVMEIDPKYLEFLKECSELREA